jgi:hypothetical protein
VKTRISPIDFNSDVLMKVNVAGYLYQPESEGRAEARDRRTVARRAGDVDIGCGVHARSYCMTARKILE